MDSQEVERIVQRVSVYPSPRPPPPPRHQLCITPFSLFPFLIMPLACHQHLWEILNPLNQRLQITLLGLLVGMHMVLPLYLFLMEHLLSTRCCASF